MENNKRHLIIVAMILGVVLILGLTFIFTRDNSSEPENAGENDLAQQEGIDQQPQDQSEAPAANRSGTTQDSEDRSALETALDDPDVSDADKLQMVKDYCAMGDLWDETRCTSWGQYAGATASICAMKEVGADGWCGSTAARRLFELLLSEAGIDDWSDIGSIAAIESENPALLVKHRAFVFVPENGLILLFVKQEPL